MINNTIKLIFLTLCISLNVLSADIPKLTKLFKQNFDNYYTPRFCGKNTRLFIEEAQKRDIDLSNSYVLKIVGGGFLETSGFFTRTNPNERMMLGYFHMVLVADGKIFDFDLNMPKVLDKEDYVRLQFTPTEKNYTVYGINYLNKGNPSQWDVTLFDTEDYANGIETTVKELKMDKFINISRMLRTRRKN
jgi:hypothetical protein